MSPSRSRSRSLRFALLLAVLAGVQVVHALWRLESLATERRHDLLLRVERDLDELATSLRALIEESRGHAAYLARSPAVAELLDSPAPTPERRRELESHLLAYLVSFPSSDRIQGFDAEGNERFRCERIGQGVGALPPTLLGTRSRPQPDPLAEIGPDGITLSPPIVDDERVELPPGERQVFEHGVVVCRDTVPRGRLVLSVLASPTLARVRRFGRDTEVSALLIDANGRLLSEPSTPVPVRAAASIGGAETADAARTERDKLLELPPRALDEIVAGARRTETDGDVYLGRLVSATPEWHLVGHVPRAVLERTVRRLEGEYLWILASLVLVTILVFAGAILLVRRRLEEAGRREAEARKSLERRLRQYERLGSLGLLTAGVAHEINNPLEGIGNYLALLERDGAGDSERRERWLAQVRYGFERIRTIVSSLSNFARARPTGGPANVARTVEQALALLRHSSGFRGVEVQCEGVAEASDVAVDPGQLEQVLINLLLNASRAMEGEGRIWIRARTIDDPRSGASSVEITHEDEGPGIAEEALETIFDPFFSTTGSTGLGLSVSYGIITAHGGALSAENRPEGGARFTIRVPAATPAAVPEERGAKRAAE